MSNTSVQALKNRSTGLIESWNSRRKYTHTDESDTLIRQAYHRWIEYGNRRSIPGVAAKLGWPKYVITKRGRELGLARTKEKPWTPTEEAILEDWGWMSVPRIARRVREAGYKRSETAIHLKMKRMKIKGNLDGWCMRGLSQALGVDDKKIAVWIKRGFLKAKDTGVVVGKNEKVFVASKDVRHFILDHPDEIELARIDKFWLLSVLCPNELCRDWRAEAA